jgi:hypothetical protein
MLQPAMIGGGEYQTNADLAWVVRMNLMMLANVEVHTGVEVMNISYTQVRRTPCYKIMFKSGDEVLARRVIIATGLGNSIPFKVAGTELERELDFYEFMAQMDNPFPLRNMRRVAVVGAGDSGKTAVETLLGQGPSTGMSVSGLDFVNKIDWYGATWNNQQDFCNANRGRYNRIGKALGGRLIPKPRLNYYPTSGYQSVQIGGKSYDWVINCTGFTRKPFIAGFAQEDSLEFKVSGRVVGRRAYVSGTEDEVYEVGPAACLSLPESDRSLSPSLSKVAENLTSLFRYAPLTAALADNLKVLPSR